MTRMLVVAVVTALVLALLAPAVSLIGYGLWYDRDIQSGIRAAVLETLGAPMFEPDAEAIDSASLRVSESPVIWMGKLISTDLAETSGLAASRQAPDQLFAINDSGNKAILYTLKLDGQVGRYWPIDYPDSHDFEDLAAFELDGKSYALVADTGDNLYWRRSLTILILESPESVADGTRLTPAWQISVTFPQGYRDVEAVAVDEDSQSIYLVSKRHVPPEVFRLPLQPDVATVVAEPVARLAGIPRPTDSDLREDPNYGPYRSLPTAFDINGRDAMVLTYKEAYLYHRGFGEAWPDVFSRHPVRVPLPNIHGLEAGAFDADGRHIYVTGEREDGIGPADLFRVDL